MEVLVPESPNWSCPRLSPLLPRSHDNGRLRVDPARSRSSVLQTQPISVMEEPYGADRQIEDLRSLVVREGGGGNGEVLRLHRPGLARESGHAAAQRVREDGGVELRRFLRLLRVPQ